MLVSLQVHLHLSYMHVDIRCNFLSEIDLTTVLTTYVLGEAGDAAMAEVVVYFLVFQRRVCILKCFTLVWTRHTNRQFPIPCTPTLMKGRLLFVYNFPRCVIPNITLCKYLIHFSSNNVSCAPGGALGSLAETPAALFFPLRMDAVHLPR